MGRLGRVNGRVVKVVEEGQVGSELKVLGGGSQASVGNVLLKSKFDLTEGEIDVVLLALNGVDSSISAIDSVVNKRYTFSTKDYARFKGLSEADIHSNMLESATSLFRKEIRITEGDTVTLCHWVSEISTYGDNDRIGIVFSPTIHKYIFDLKGSFTRIRLQSILATDGRYTKRLYLLLEQERFKGLNGKLRLNINDLCEAWDVPAKSRVWRVFRQNILKPAIVNLANAKYASISIEAIGYRKPSEFILEYTLVSLPETLSERYRREIVEGLGREGR